jgi:hypothetical protein
VKPAVAVYRGCAYYVTCANLILRGEIMKYGGLYWNIKQYLPYQRCFNLINSERSIGKTYTTQGFFLERALEHGEEFVYIVRTQDEKEKGVFGKAFEKVCIKEYQGKNIQFTKEECVLKIEDEDGNTIDSDVLGHCIALSEATKSKKLNFPNVRWLMFDEYILDDKESRGYVTGWNEPDLLLKIYHTIDRERDYVICFLLANNITFYNPYHMHKAFNIPHTEKDKVWFNENVLFHWVSASLELKQKKSKCKFLKMIEGTDYGDYSKEGIYIGDNVNFIGDRTPNSRFVFTLSYKGDNFGVWQDNKIGLIFIDEKCDPSCPLKYALTLSDHTENTLLTKNRNNSLLVWLSTNFKRGNVRYSNMRLKVKCEEAIKLIL